MAARQSLRVEDKGRLVAVGAADGSTTILEISEGLYTPQVTHGLQLQPLWRVPTAAVS